MNDQTILNLKNLDPLKFRIEVPRPRKHFTDWNMQRARKPNRVMRKFGSWHNLSKLDLSFVDSRIERNKVQL